MVALCSIEAVSGGAASLPKASTTQQSVVWHRRQVKTARVDKLSGSAETFRVLAVAYACTMARAASTAAASEAKKKNEWSFWREGRRSSF